ncbi:MAG: T9SS type A sorting domain-containing protein [Sphingobacteriales bacterium]|nr:MAG: T9SS type A sorting domain-containing protein [Sphingobacteriales bacterium]
MSLDLSGWETDSDLMKIEFTDMIGKTVFQKNITAKSIKSILEVDIATLPSGFYLVKASDGQDTITKKLVVQ